MHTLFFTIFAIMASLAMINSNLVQADWVEFNGASYKIFGLEHAANHEMARAICQQHSADLASINSPAEDYFIRGLIAHLMPGPSSAAAVGGFQGFHIGLHQMSPNGNRAFEGGFICKSMKH